MHLKFRPDIDGIRALAVLAVVVYHTFPEKLSGGFTGVDVFFVISGYLISSTIINQLNVSTFSFKDFYARRIRRIFPSLITILLSSFIFAWFALLPSEFIQLGKNMLSGALFVSNFSLWQESGYFDINAAFKPLLHLWSLSIEEQFYLFWPFILCFIYKKSWQLVWILSLIWLSSFAYSVYAAQTNTVAAFYSPLSRCWELATGGLLACFKCNKLLTSVKLNQRYNQKLIQHLLSIVGMVLVLYGLFFIHESFAFPGFWALIPVIGTLTLIAVNPSAMMNRYVLANPAMTFFGKISYSLYLWHWPIISYLWILESGKPDKKIRIVAIVASVVLAWLTTRYIEQPLRYSKHKHTPILLVVMLIGIGSLGYVTMTLKGFELRSALKDTIRSNSAPTRFEADNPVKHSACLAIYQLSENVRFCNTTQNNADAQIALIGDSHSKMMYKAVIDDPEIRNYGVVNIGGRLFLDLIAYAKGSAFEKKVNLGGIEATQTAANNPAIQYVALFSRGPAYFDETMIFHLISQPEITDKEKVWEIAMRKTLDAFANKKSVVFVVDNPDIPFTPLSCVEGRPLRITSFRRDCSFPRADYEHTALTYRKIVFNVLKDYPKVKVLDMSKLFCDESKCVAKKDGKILYLDDNHLSYEGAKLITRDLLDKLIGGGSAVQ